MNIYIYIYIYNLFIYTYITHKTAAIQPPTPISKTIQMRRIRHAGHCIYIYIYIYI